MATSRPVSKYADPYAFRKAMGDAPAGGPGPSFPSVPTTLPIPGIQTTVFGGAGGVSSGGTSFPGGTTTTTSTPSAGSSIPPELTNLNITGSAPKELTDLSTAYNKQLSDIEAGRSREANLFNTGLSSDIERQVAAAKEQALANGQPFNEAAMRAELARGANASKAQFALGTQQQALQGTAAGLDIAKAPFEAEMQAKGLSLDTQKMLADYAIQRGGLVNDAEKNQLTAAGTAYDAYIKMLQLMIANAKT